MRPNNILYQPFNTLQCEIAAPVRVPVREVGCSLRGSPDPETAVTDSVSSRRVSVLHWAAADRPGGVWIGKRMLREKFQPIGMIG